MSNQNDRSDDPANRQPKEACAAGDGRARKDTRYKPGQSGNYKGRPKGSKNHRSQLHKVYTEPVPIKLRGKRRPVAALVALQFVLLQRGLKDDNRAAEIVLKHAKEFGFFEQTEMHVCSCRDGLSDEAIARLTNPTLNELIRVEQALQAEKENSKKKPH
jgi:hypothetical protein